MIRTAAARTTLAALLFALFAGTLGATRAAAAGADGDRGWPRLFTLNGTEVTLHQPQVDEWKDFTTLKCRLAVTVKLRGAKEPAFGVVELRAATATDHAKRMVTVYKPEILAVRFANVPPEQAAALEQAVRTVPPYNGTDIALDRVLAYVKLADDRKTGVAVSFDPPPIFYSEREAAVVSFLGEPRFTKIEGNPMEFGLNTNWDVFRDPEKGVYYLLYRGGWMKTADLVKGPWEATSAPSELKKLPKDGWERVLKSIPGEKLKTVPQIFVSSRPAEIILTSGRPAFADVPGTGLAEVSNSKNTLFFHKAESQFYFLAAGRWFRAKDLNGPWTFATTNLPADFARIPKNGPKAWVLASVPGTQEASDAILIASIPKTGVVYRSEAKATVTYDGAPIFVPIEKTTVLYAVNTPYDVFKVGTSYYTCYQAVWFVAPAATGPWVVAASVPAAIYGIPPTSPKYHVTYVTIVGSTPTTVTCAHTSGYEGEVVAAGVVMFGVGMAVGASTTTVYYYGYYPPYYWGYGYPYPPYYGHAYVYASPYGYGWSAYGPYGGAGYGAKYNPATGVYSRAGYAYGPNGGSAYRTAYNPSTGTWAGQRAGYNEYGAWKQTAVVKGDDWAKSTKVANSQGTAGGFQTSGGAAGVGAKGNEGGSGYVVKDGQGNVYAGKDGNVYKRDESGNWSSPTGSTPPPKASAASTSAAQTGAGTSAAQTGAGTAKSGGQPATMDAGTRDSLNSDAKARSSGNASAAQHSASRGSAAGSRSGGGRRR